MSEIPPQDQTLTPFRKTLSTLSSSPIPGLAFSSALLSTIFLNPSTQTAKPASSDSKLSQLFKNSAANRPLSAGPNKLSALLFSGFIGLGSFMIIDNDVVNGSGVIGAWSFLYCLSHYKKSVLNFKLTPKLLVGLSGMNCIVYCGRFFGFY